MIATDTKTARWLSPWRWCPVLVAGAAFGAAYSSAGPPLPRNDVARAVLGAVNGALVFMVFYAVVAFAFLELSKRRSRDDALAEPRTNEQRVAELRRNAWISLIAAWFLSFFAINIITGILAVVHTGRARRELETGDIDSFDNQCAAAGTMIRYTWVMSKVIAFAIAIAMAVFVGLMASGLV